MHILKMILILLALANTSYAQQCPHLYSQSPVCEGLRNAVIEEDKVQIAPLLQALQSQKAKVTEICDLFGKQRVQTPQVTTVGNALDLQKPHLAKLKELKAEMEKQFGREFSVGILPAGIGSGANPPILSLGQVYGKTVRRTDAVELCSRETYGVRITARPRLYSLDISAKAPGHVQYLNKDESVEIRVRKDCQNPCILAQPLSYEKFSSLLSPVAPSTTSTAPD